MANTIIANRSITPDAIQALSQQATLGFVPLTAPPRLGCCHVGRHRLAGPIAGTSPPELEVTGMESGKYRTQRGDWMGTAVSDYYYNTYHCQSYLLWATRF